MSMLPYTVAIPQADIDDLYARLARVRWTNELPDAGTAYGVDLASIKRLVTYWQHGYDWRIWEAKLNAYPQFTTTIDGETVHFLHIRSHVENALPLLVIHGWPRSVFDYLTVIDPLVDPRSRRRSYDGRGFLSHQPLTLPERGGARSYAGNGKAGFARC